MNEYANESMKEAGSSAAAVELEERIEMKRLFCFSVFSLCSF